jgi:hypothetical protein
MDFITIEPMVQEKNKKFNIVKWTFVDFCFFKK